MKYRATVLCVLGIMLLPLPPSRMALAVAQGADTISLSGRITTDFGCAIPGVTVVVSADAGSEILGKAVTDANGLYSFARLPEGKGPVKIVAESRGFTRAERTMFLARNYPNIWDAGLAIGPLVDSGYRVAGRVLDGRKRPLADATVSLLRPYMDGKLLQIRSDAQGRFLFDNVDPESFVVIVTRPAYEAASRLVKSAPSDSNTVESFTLAPCKRCPEGRLP